MEYYIATKIMKSCHFQQNGQTGRHYVKQTKPNTERHALFILFHVWDLKSKSGPECRKDITSDWKGPLETEKSGSMDAHGQFMRNECTEFLYTPINLNNKI
jgi:hypothetical protein